MEARIIRYIPHDINLVWDLVTNIDNQNWRTDLIKIKKLGNNHFIEYKKNGIHMEFNILEKVPLKSYSFAMKSKFTKGTWKGIFEKTDDGCTIEFVEVVTFKNKLLKPFIMYIIKKEQKQYAKDLKKMLKQKKEII